MERGRRWWAAAAAPAAGAADELGRRPRHVVLGALTLGLALEAFRPALVVAAGAGAVVLGLAIARPRLALAAAIAVLAGGLGGQARLAALDRTALSAERGRTIATRVVVLERPRTRRFGAWSAAGRIAGGLGGGERIVLRGERPARPPAVDVGDIVGVQGHVEPLARWEDYERIRGSHAALVPERLWLTGLRRGGAAGAVDSVRRRAEAALAAGLPPPQAALAHGMVLGQDDALDARTRADFQASGLAHLLAASGQNVALLAALAAAVLSALGVGLRTRLLGALGLIALYVPLAGGGPSIQRAGIMGAAGIAAALAGRPASRSYALLLAAAATLALNPRSAADVGWQLSFAAVLAIALLAGRWSRALTARRVPRAVAEVAALSGAATVGTAPLMAAHFGRLSLVSLPANLVVAPAVAPLVWLGTTSAALGQLGAGAAQPSGILAVLADRLDHLVETLAAPPLGFIGWVAHVAATAPGATAAVALGGPLVAVAGYAGLGAVATSRRARLVVAGGTLAALAVAGWLRLHPPGPPPGLTVSFLDIGQGDATLIQDGPRAILVDTGPPEGEILARLRAAGVRRLDLLVLTHAQRDHEGAAAAILRALPVAAVLDGGQGAGSPERRTIATAERATAVRPITPDAGQVLRDGPLALDVLWPKRSEPALPGEDPNLHAIVAIVRDGAFSMLLTADAESDVTLPLDLPPVDVLKVAHHGSADPGLPALLERLRPRLAAIEVGRHNPYGHPSPTTLRALSSVPTLIRTDRDGTVRVTVHGRRLLIRAHA